MTATAWAHLPNAAHIDRILASVRENPERWRTAQNAAWDTARHAARHAAWDTARHVARGAVLDAVRDAAWDTARHVARGAVLDAVRDAARGAAWNTAWDAILALLAWDDCAYILELPEDALKVLRAVGNEQAILLSAAAHALRETS